MEHLNVITGKTSKQKLQNHINTLQTHTAQTKLTKNHTSELCKSMQLFQNFLVSFNINFVLQDPAHIPPTEFHSGRSTENTLHI